MIPKQRMLLALNHKEPDRVPLGELGIDSPITEKALRRKTFYRAKWREWTAIWQGGRDEVVESQKKDMVDLVRRFEWDFVTVHLVPSKYKIYKKPKFLEKYTWEDEEGRVWKYSPLSEGWPICIKQREIGLKDLKESSPSELEPDESELELVRYVVRELGETHFILGRTGDGSFWRNPFIFGGGGERTFIDVGSFESYLMKMITNPEFIFKATQIGVKQAIATSTALLEAGCDGVIATADYCSSQGSLMSPEHFRKFVYPALKKHCDAVHHKGGYFIKHTDGNTWPILEMMVEAGIDGYQGIQLNAGMDMRKLREKYGNKICLFGGVDCDTLIKGSREDVKREVEYAIKYAASGGGLVITSGNTVTAGTKYENYIDMLETTKERGRYPVSFD